MVNGECGNPHNSKFTIPRGQAPFYQRGLEFRMVNRETVTIPNSPFPIHFLRSLLGRTTQSPNSPKKATPPSIASMPMFFRSLRQAQDRPGWWSVGCRASLGAAMALPPLTPPSRRRSGSLPSTSSGQSLFDISHYSRAMFRRCYADVNFVLHVTKSSGAPAFSGLTR